jgi:hypothetical protein
MAFRKVTLLFIVLLLSFCRTSHADCDPGGSCVLPGLSVTDLVDTSSRQNRWMSLPFSRLVVNPCDFWYPTEPIVNSPEVTLQFNAGYYAGRDAVRLENIWQLYRRTGSTSSSITELPLNMGRGAWTAESNASVEETTLGLRLSASGPSPQCATCAAIRQQVECNVTQDTWVRITVPEATEAWALKVANGPNEREKTIQRDIISTGTHYYNLGVATGWRGKQNLRISIYAATLRHPFTIAECALLQVRDAALCPAERCETSWSPHELVTTATYHGLRAESHDAFADDNSVVRTLQFAGASRDTTFAISGAYTGKLTWSAADRCLMCEGTTCTYAICFPVGVAEFPTYYGNQLELAAQLNGNSAALPNRGYWCIGVAKTAQPTLSCGFGFAPLAEGAAAARDRAKHAAGQDALTCAAAQANRWNSWLAKVPRLQNFTINSVDPLSVTVADVRRAYYKAWVFFESDFLPQMPETGFAYVQLACGKPSLWAEGHPKARPTASWDSLFAMQMEAYVHPDAAWESFTGLMSLVDADGALWGESLPSRKAQTARILFDQTHDLGKLRAIYPALKRHLLWAERNPRWIYREHNYPDEKDADFVVSVLVDFEHMRALAGELGLAEDAALWQQHRSELCANYEKWFWPNPEGEPIEILHTSTGKTSNGNTLWVSSGLALDELTSGARLDGMLRRFRREFNLSRAMGGLVMPKYPELSLLMHGLLSRGMQAEAAQLANVCVRDVTRANMFAEQYFTWDFPTPDGVRPSAFGAALLVDMLWMKNGYRMDRMGKASVQLQGEPAGKIEMQK